MHIANWTLLIESISPSAAGISVSGRVVTFDGRGIGRTLVTLSGGVLGQPVSTITNPFGFYRLPDVPAGYTYVVSVADKHYSFAEPDRAVNAADNVSDLNFTALP